MDAFLKLFGHYTIGDAITIIIVIGSIIGVYCKLKPYLSAKYDKSKDIDEMLERYPIWHQQSINIQKKFTDAIDELKKGQEENTKRLEDIDKENKKRELNRLRDLLLQSYRYYTNLDKNPMQAWSEMEADAFWEIFADYEDLNGDGHMHAIVQPAMVELTVIEMHETEKIVELMRSRK